MMDAMTYFNLNTNDNIYLLGGWRGWAAITSQGTEEEMTGDTGETEMTGTTGLRTEN